MTILNSNQFGSIDLSDLSNFEESNDLKLPDDYKEFLTKHNGGVPANTIVQVGNLKTDVQIIFGMHDGPYYSNFWQRLDMFYGRIPSWYIPVAGDSGGNLFIMSLWEGNSGTVAFWEHETEAPLGQADQYFDNMIKVADSFTQFLGMLKPLE